MLGLKLIHVNKGATGGAIEHIASVSWECFSRLYSFVWGIPVPVNLHMLQETPRTSAFHLILLDVYLQNDMHNRTKCHGQWTFRDI